MIIKPIKKQNYDHDLKPVELFHTPENWGELNKWIMIHSDGVERTHVMTAAYMAWNLACKIANDE